MATTQNFRLTGLIQTPGSITAQLNGTTVWNGPVGTTVVDGLVHLATGTFSYDKQPSPLLPLHTVVPCVITVQSGLMDIGLWEWDPPHVLNPALPEECKAYYNYWDALPDGTPWAPNSTLESAAVAAGNWYIIPSPPEWWSGGKPNGPITRFNMLLNGTPINTYNSESYPGPWNVPGLKAGDVLTYDLAIPNF